MAIRGEQTGTEELIKDGLFHWSALLGDPETEQLAKPVRQAIDLLKTADQATRASEETAVEKAALLERGEYLHDSLQRECELDVLKRAKKNRQSDGYRSVYPSGLSSLIMLFGKEQERAVEGMLKALEVEYPDLAKQYKKSLAELAKKATQAEEEWEAAEAKAGQAFQSERLQRTGLVRVMQRSEGALLSLFPGDRARVRSYFRDHKRGRRPDAEIPAPSPAPAP